MKITDETTLSCLIEAISYQSACTITRSFMIYYVELFLTIYKNSRTKIVELVLAYFSLPFSL